ncbi:peptidyl-prolyl cis-trans isomerase [Candidatus Micrarchaeota archaeon]|nr:peptidyl-prolyl cis-trans isomerase [Candidatus Micrarchaeota archaeon]
MKVRASHILVNSMEKANSIIADLGKGGDFAALARRYSSCPSGKQGGDLGFFSKGQMVKEFEDVAFSLEPGKVSGPVKTQFGYHIIKVTERK